MRLHEEEGAHVISTDEKTGIHIHPTQQRLLAFINYFNAVLAKPFHWTYSGKPLRV